MDESRSISTHYSLLCDAYIRPDENIHEKSAGNQANQVAHPSSVPINRSLFSFRAQWCDDVIQNGPLFDKNFSNPLHWPALNREQGSPSPRASAVDQFSPCVAEGKLIDRVTLAKRLENKRPWI